jgi:hypothetical protein
MPHGHSSFNDDWTMGAGVSGLPEVTPEGFTHPIIKKGENKEAALTRILDEVEKVHLECVQSRTLSKYRGTWIKYSMFCSTLGRPMAGTNGYVDSVMLAAFLLHRAKEVESSSSIVAWGTHVIGYAYLARGMPRIPKDHPQRRYLTETCKGIATLIPATYRPRAALYGAHLAELVKKSQALASDDLNGLVRTVQTLFAYNAALRPNEHCVTDNNGVDLIPPLTSDNVKLITDTTGSPGGVQLTIPRSKAHRRETDPSLKSQPHLVFFPARTDALDAVGPLMRLIRILSRNPTIKEQPLFPTIVNGLPTEKIPTLAEFNKWLTTSLKTHNIPVTTAQGLRSGRRSDLTNAGVKEEIILKLGRWKSTDGSRRYYQTSADGMNSLLVSIPTAPAIAQPLGQLSDYESSESEDEPQKPQKPIEVTGQGTDLNI